MYNKKTHIFDTSKVDTIKKENNLLKKKGCEYLIVVLYFGGIFKWEEKQNIVKMKRCV